MITSFVTRGLQLVFGYVYPAYECYKTVELNKPDIDQLRFWCQYWILVAGLTVCEKICDTFIGWVPMYGEAKLAFFIYLWFPKTQGTTYVYNSFFKPYVEKHEPEIDRNLLEFKTRAGDMAVLSWQKVASYGQTRIYEILQYIASQSPPSQQSQQQPQGPRVPKPNVPPNRTSTAPIELDRQPSSSASKAPSSSSEQPKDAGVVAPSEDPKAATAPTTTNELKTTTSPSIVESSKITSTSIEVQSMQIDSAAPTADDNTQPLPPQDLIARVTQARPRRTTRAANRAATNL